MGSDFNVNLLGIGTDMDGVVSHLPIARFVVIEETYCYFEFEQQFCPNFKFNGFFEFCLKVFCTKYSMWCLSICSNN